MRTLMALLILLAFSAPQTSAVVDPDPDGIGVYFDVDADIYETPVAPSLPFNAYVIITNPTDAEILGYEFAYRISVIPSDMEGLFFRLSMTFVPDDFSLPPYDPFEGEVVRGPFNHFPIPGEPAVVIVTWQFMVLSPVIEVEFFLGPTSEGHLLYHTEDGPVPLHVSSGDPELPVAMLNREGVVPTTETTFGSLKALFR